MISERLLTIASLVDNDAIVADIGSDHALLPIYLVKENIAKKAYAIDNKEGPLSGAIENIEAYHLEEKVKTRLASGLDKLEKDVNVAIIAGMGFNTISMIINDDLKRAQELDNVIIQCNNHLPEMRRFLNNKGFKINTEKFIEINKQEYIILKASYVNDTIENMDYYVSSYLIEMKDESYIKYLMRRKNHLEELKSFNEEFQNEYMSIEQALKE